MPARPSTPLSASSAAKPPPHHCPAFSSTAIPGCAPCSSVAHSVAQPFLAVLPAFLALLRQLPLSTLHSRPANCRSLCQAAIQPRNLTVQYLPLAGTLLTVLPSAMNSRLLFGNHAAAFLASRFGTPRPRTGLAAVDAANPFRIRTYSPIPRFSRNQPKLAPRNPCRIRICRSRRRNSFRIRTYKKRTEAHPLIFPISVSALLLYSQAGNLLYLSALSMRPSRVPRLA